MLQKPESDRFRLVKKELGKSSVSDPTAIRRAIIAAEAIAKNTNKTMSRDEFEELASSLKYGVQATYLERVYGYFAIWQKEQSEKEQKRIDGANKVKEEQLKLRKKAERTKRTRQKQQDEKEQKIIDDVNKAIKEQINLHEKAEQKEYDRQKRLDSVIKIAGQLQNRIINPETYYKKYNDTSTWQWGKQDWRFAPTAWFDVMTPRLDDKYILERDFPGFNSFKQHVPNISFWVHYKKLKRKSNSLGKDIDEAVEKLKIEDFPNYEEFIDYSSFIEDFPLKGAWSPKHKTSVKEIPPLNPDEIEFLEKVFQKLTKYVPNYKKRLDELENLLQQLWDDLNPAKIEEMIEQGSCSSPKCFPRL